MDLTTTFELVIQPVGTVAAPGGEESAFTYFATFSDSQKVFHSIKFASAQDLHQFARHIALVKDCMYTASYKRGGARKMVVQDLLIGASDSSPCEVALHHPPPPPSSLPLCT